MVCTEGDLRPDGIVVLDRWPLEINLDAAAATKLIFKQLRRTTQGIDHNIEIAIFVQIDHDHAASTGG